MKESIKETYKLYPPLVLSSVVLTVPGAHVQVTMMILIMVVDQLMLLLMLMLHVLM